MSLTSLLSIARSALLTHQKAVDTTGHNIANASTPGYTRQRLSLTAEVPLQTPIGQVGRGVTADGIERLRDSFLDTNYRRENGELGRFTTLKDTLGQVEEVFGEPSSTGLGSGIDSFLAAFGDLANDPSGTTPRTLVRQAAQNLVQQFRQADQRLTAIGADVREKMIGQVDQVNQLAQQIADLNIAIRAGNSGLKESPDLKDKRDVLIDQLSGIAGVRVIDRPDGTVGVAAGDALLVDGGSVGQLSVRDMGQGKLEVSVAGSSLPISLKSGSLAGLIDLGSNTLPGVRDKLNTLVSSIVTEVNAVHRNGRGLNGGANIDFFDPAGLTVDTVNLSAAIRNSTDNIAAGVSGAAGDNTNALAIAALRTTGVASQNGQTLSGGYQQLVSELAVSLNDVSSRTEAQSTIASNADAQRQSVSGVSVDEELTALITQQNAYAAAARLVTVADDMIKDVIGMVR
ncbi:MAG: flagellar hook-associated protein FlgK [Gemmatimonadales bacterium]